MTKHDRSDEIVCETSPCHQAPCRRLLVCCPENHLPSINWETKLGKQSGCDARGGRLGDPPGARPEVQTPRAWETPEFGIKASSSKLMLTSNRTIYIYSPKKRKPSLFSSSILGMDIRHKLLSAQPKVVLEHPRNKKMLAPTGPASGRIAVKRPPRTFQKSQTPNFLDHYWSRCGVARFFVLRFRVVAVFRVIPEHPTGLADDDATTTTRNTKPASYAPTALMILAVGHVAFVSCATPRGAGRDKFKRQRRSGVVVFVSVFVTHQEARSCF